MDRISIIQQLRAQININGHILGVATGSGLTVKYTVMGGADLILALSAGKFRQMGRSSLASFLCYSNSNETVMNFATKELLPLLPGAPVLFGLHANDPMIHLYDYINKIKQYGFAGINNFPTVGLIDGQFREALEEDGQTFEKEVEAIKIARFLDLFTIAFVFDTAQARAMLEAGADVICAHLGLTTGGMLGAKKGLSLELSREKAEEIFQVCDEVRPDVIRMVYGGPIKTPLDVHYFIEHTSCQGFIGGSSFERIPSERAILHTTKAFKTFGSFDEKDAMVRVLSGKARNYDYVNYVKEHIEKNFHKPVYLRDLALAAHISESYLSGLFKKETGVSFTEYLVRFRIGKACEILRNENTPIVEVARMAGYPDYAHFSRIFKKYQGVSPKNYRDQI